MTDNANVDLEDLVHLEQTFYDAGYTDGFAHGRIHGLLQGRALGRHHGFSLWEEIGFYQGFARTWGALPVSARGGGRRQQDQFARATHHITHLLDLVGRFPTVNPSSSVHESDNTTETETDLVSLQRQIRSRYKALCASLGLRPSLRAGASPGNDAVDIDIDDGEGEGDRRAANGMSGAGAKRDVWTLERDIRRSTMQGLSF